MNTRKLLLFYLLKAEVVKLKPEDIDSKRMLIHIKGAKDGRYLSIRTVQAK